METQATPRPWHNRELGDIAYIYGPAPDYANAQRCVPQEQARAVLDQIAAKEE